MAYDWTEIKLGLNRNQEWNDVSCSSDGSVILGEFTKRYTVMDWPIFISRDSGASWTFVEPPFAKWTSYVYQTLWLSADGNTIFFHYANVGYYHLLYKTTDDGANWTSIDMSAGETANSWWGVDINSDGSVIAVVGSPASGNDLVNISTDSGASFTSYEVTYPSQTVALTYVKISDSGAKGILVGTAGGSRIWTSTDSLATWTSRAVTSPINLIKSAAISADGSTMIVNCRNNNLSSPADRIYKSTNDGVSWTDINYATDGPGVSIAISADGQTIFSGSENTETLYYTTNAGSSWSTAEPAGDLSADTALDWADLSVQGDTILAVGGKPHGKNIYISLDGGLTWDEKRIGEQFEEYYSSVSITSDGQKILTYNERDGVYFSTDGGTTMTPFVGQYGYDIGFYEGDDSEGFTVKVSKDGSLFFVAGRYMIQSQISWDNGVTWSVVDFSGEGIAEEVAWKNNATIVDIAMSENGRVIVLTGNFYQQFPNNDYWEIVISTDYGVTWTGVVNPVAGGNAYNWRVAVTDDGLVILITDESGQRLYRSIDSGASFSLVYTFDTHPQGMTCDSTGNTIVIWDWSDDIYVSSNAGSSFSRVYDGSEEEWMYYVGREYSESLVVNDDGDFMIFMTGDNIYLTSNSGSSWAFLDDTLGDDSVPTISGDSSNYAIAFGYEKLYITIVATEEEGFSDAGYYPAVYIHGKRIEDGESALKNQTQVDMDWKLPFAYPYIIGAPDDIIEYRRIRVQHTTPFWTQEKSLENSRPIELHRFSTATEIWRYADAPCDVDYNGTDGVVIFRGFVQNVNFKQDSRNGVRRAEVTIEPYSGNTLLQALAMTYERLCPVALYGELCGVDQDESGATWHDSGVLTGVTNTVLTASEFGDKVDGWYDGGKIVINNRRRKILTHTGTSITISRIIYGTAVGDDFDVYAGCYRLPATCKSKFDNLNNCKALPHIPHEDNNPFGNNGAVQ